MSKLSYYAVPTPPSPTPKLSSPDLQGQCGGLRMRFLNLPSLLIVYLSTPQNALRQVWVKRVLVHIQ